MHSRKLQRNGVIRRRGTRYVLTDRRILYQDDDARSHGLEALRGLLRTLDRNLLDENAPFRLFECIASNPTIPIDALARFDERVRSPAVEFLHSADTELTRLYGRRQPKEKTCRVGVGVFVFANAVHPTTKIHRPDREAPLMSARRRPVPKVGPKAVPKAVVRNRANQLQEASRLFLRLLQGCGYGSDEISDAIQRDLRRAPNNAKPAAISTCATTPNPRT